MHEDGNVAMKLVAAATATGTGSAKNPARGEASAYGKFCVNTYERSMEELQDESEARYIEHMVRS